jgi:hypothetical protein
VKRLADKPFVLLGINSDADRTELKKAMEKESVADIGTIGNRARTYDNSTSATLAQTLTFENSPAPDLAQLRDSWAELDPKLKHMMKMLAEMDPKLKLMLAALEPDRPGA